jgi:hypothetical protein
VARRCREPAIPRRTLQYLNHTNFAFPFSNNFNANYQAIVSANTSVATSSGIPTNVSSGQITNTLINARQIQFALKFEF